MAEGREGKTPNKIQSHPRVAFFMAKEYTCITFTTLSEEQSDLLVALLADLGYHGFEEGEDQLKAFISSDEFDSALLEPVVQIADSDYLISREEEKNWNEIWESSFEPVVIPGFVAVRASFHPPVTGVEHEIVITPKMSFGTGHHATTWLMMDRMSRMDFLGKRVLDFGTGTGILAILAEKLGAAQVDAIDNDPICLASTEENLRENGSRHVRAWQADQVPDGPYDIILANINKHILLAGAERLKAALSVPGELVLSGLLEGDETDIRGRYLSLLGEPSGLVLKNNWLCISFTSGT
jgi:ribosomal protein L11 methyltransferase